MDIDRQCRGTSKQSHERCKRAAIRGGSVCNFHGGYTPVVLAKAEERMRALVHPAIAALAKLIDDNDLAAAKYVLDYAGFKATEKVQQEGTVTVEIELVSHNRPRLNGTLNAADSTA